jgi:thiol-disulfide isomerase/thioredoxin
MLQRQTARSCCRWHGDAPGSPSLSLGLGIARLAGLDKNMKSRVLPTGLCLCFMLVVGAQPVPTPVDGADNPTERKIYDESANGDKQLADATVIARRERKHILLQFGANWCASCQKLHKLFESDKSIREELLTNYVLVLIDVNQGHNKDFAAEYGAAKHRIPFLAVLNRDGKAITTKDIGDLAEENHHSPEKVSAFLKTCEPGAIIGYSLDSPADPKITLVGCEDRPGQDGLRRLYSFRAENPTDAEILCRVHADHKTEPQDKILSISRKGSAPFDFLMPASDTPKIAAEVLGPVSRFTVPLPNPKRAASRSQPVSSETNRSSAAAGSGR